MSARGPLSILFLGPSGSGKSFGASLLCKRLGNPVVVLEGPVDTYKEKNSKVTAVSWDELPMKKRNITYVLEDLHRLKATTRETVAILTNYVSRHFQSAVIILAHSITGNGIFSILHFLTDIYVTSNQINIRPLRTLLRHFYYDDAAEVERKFLALKGGGYLHLQPQQRTCVALDSDLDIVKARDDTPVGRTPSPEVPPAAFDRDKLVAFFAHLPQKSQYANLADYLLRIIPPNSVNNDDFSVSFRNKKKTIQKFSLIDYLHYLMSEEIPPRKILSFQRHLTRRACFPLSLVRNDHMKRFCT